MKCTGKLTQIFSDYARRKYLVTLEVNEDIREEYDRLKDKEMLSIEVKQYRRKRSLNANAYFHVLVGEIAQVLVISPTRCKNILLGRYGQPEILENGEHAIIKTNIPVAAMLEYESLHCQCVGSRQENGQEVIFYKLIRGSHTYDTKEMSVLIDGTVQEAKDLGIETATPDEIERMKQQWGVEIE